MSPGEIAILALILTAFGAFSITLACCSYMTSDRRAARVWKGPRELPHRGLHARRFVN